MALGLATASYVPYGRGAALVVADLRENIFLISGGSLLVNLLSLSRGRGGEGRVLWGLEKKGCFFEAQKATCV